MSNDARRLQTTLQCVNLHAHQLLCNNLEHPCCSHSLDHSKKIPQPSACTLRTHLQFQFTFLTTIMGENSWEKSAPPEQPMADSDCSSSESATKHTCTKKSNFCSDGERRVGEDHGDSGRLVNGAGSGDPHIGELKKVCKSMKGHCKKGKHM